MKIVELDPDAVIVKDRFRKSFSEPDLNALCESIKTFGQLQPIGVKINTEGKPVLIFGHRRLLACKKLGIKVKAVILGQESPVIDELLDQKLIEFVENSVRRDFTPAERAEALADLHASLMERDPDWTVEKTAKLVGLTRSYVSEQLSIAKAIRTGALNREEALHMNTKQLLKAKSTIEQLKKVKEAVLKTQGVEKVYRILHGDAFKFEDLGLKPNSYNAVITDPPYGLDYQTLTNTDKERETHFSDDPYFMSPAFIERLWSLFDRLLHKEKGLVVCFCSLEQFPLHVEIAKKKGFPAVYPKPLIWIKASAGVPFKAKYFPVSCYEIMIFAKRSEDLPIFKVGRADWFNVPKPTGGDRVHPTQKPELLILQILESFCFPDYRIIDPFCGSGSTVIACREFGALEGTGIELNDRTARLAQERLLSLMKVSQPQSMSNGLTQPVNEEANQ